MTKSEYILLYKKYLQGVCTLQEIARLDDYKDEFELEPKAWEKEMGNESEVKQIIYSRIQAGMAVKNENNAPVVVQLKKKKDVNWTKISVAASLLFMMSTIVVYFFNHTNKTQQVATIGQRYKNDVAPGKNGAILTLSDGSKVMLDSAANGTIAAQGNVQVIEKDGQLDYNAGGASSTEILYNTLTTPRGREMVVTLSDNSVVYLNAGSSLKFPTLFNGKAREVEVSGEAYFEVAHNAAKPFIVKKMNSGIAVQVLGTHFNVNAYDDESAVKVTLLEGSVKVSDGDKTGLLKPGQQAQVTSNKIGIINDADLETTMAWKNGQFIFKSADLESIMRQISRWYDVDIQYDRRINERFNGEPPRTTNLSNLLRVLEESGKVQFVIDGKKIIVQ